MASIGKLSPPAALMLFLGAILATGPGQAAEPLLRVIKSSANATNLVKNGDFESAPSAAPSGWAKYEGGFEWAPNSGRNRSAAMVCQNELTTGGRGASQVITLNQTQAMPIIVRGWSKAENVSGAADNNYSIYVDLIYHDDTTLWGQTANFRCGTHDWEAREVVITPEKPVKRLTVYGLFRGHSGKVWFDDVHAEELRAGAGATLFQGAFVALPAWGDTPPPLSRTYSTKDGLKMTMVGDRAVGGSWMHSLNPGGFMARDVAKNSDFFGFQGGNCPNLGLQISYRITEQSNHLAIEGRVMDTTGADRAISLVFALPVLENDGQHGVKAFGSPSSDFNCGHLVRPLERYANEVQVKCGSTGTLSLYPIMPSWKFNQSVALGLDMAHPAIYRVGYHRDLQNLHLAYDFGLCRDTQKFPRAAHFRFVIFNFPPAWGFRGAWQKYMEIFPEYFAVRSKDQGIWMPFTDVSTVQGWQDFGFKYHEGNNNVKFDDENNILTFRYTEPMTWWMPMAKELPRTFATALKVRDELLASGKPGQKAPAQVTQVAAMHDESGQPALVFRDEPWCNGAVWSLNPNPNLPGEINFAKWHWSEETKQKLYGPEAKARLDGEYLDSLEGYVTSEFNFRRDHFAHTTVPLTFTADTKQPVLYKGLAVFEFTKWICEDVHRLGKLTFANSVPYRFTFLCPWLDVMGTETDWNPGGQWRPPSDSTLSQWRFMSGAKPYVLLMNTDYDALTPDLVERYFQRCAFYGFYPSMFSHNASENPYWQNPKWYNRDRALFKKYIPIIKQIAEAGWRPVTGARVDAGALWLERFGPDHAPDIYLTAFNPSAQTRSRRIALEPGFSAGRRLVEVRELLSGQALVFNPMDQSWSCTLPPEQAAVFKVRLAR